MPQLASRGSRPRRPVKLLPTTSARMPTSWASSTSRGGLWGLGNAEVGGEMEGTPFAGGTLDPNSPSHHCHQLAADIQSQARPAESTRGGANDLGEGLEDACLFLGGDADASVLHGEVKTSGLGTY